MPGFHPFRSLGTFWAHFKTAKLKFLLLSLINFARFFPIFTIMSHKQDRSYAKNRLNAIRAWARPAFTDLMRVIRQLFIVHLGIG